MKRKPLDHPALWVERFLVCRAGLYGVSSSIGSMLGQLEHTGLVGKGVTYHGGFQGTTAEQHADDSRIWDLLSTKQQLILELQNSPNTFAPKEQIAKLVSAGELLETSLPEPRAITVCIGHLSTGKRCARSAMKGQHFCKSHEGQAALQQTRSGDTVIDEQEAKVLGLQPFEEHDGQRMARVSSTRVPTWNLEEIAWLCRSTIPAVRWEIKKAHHVISRALFARAHRKACA